jgi:hypothetical protein
MVPESGSAAHGCAEGWGANLAERHSLDACGPRDAPLILRLEFCSFGDRNVHCNRANCSRRAYRRRLCRLDLGRCSG